ncbi:hypothetical protein AB4027_01240 [Alkalibacterium putridalgicola]|uniref:hypothetical protein n=1 Tax=Alkalibacterium putridalgicola TaxID=426703 RepID=UPI0034D021CF
MKKGKKYIASLLVIGGVSSVSLYNSELSNVAAHGNQEQSPDPYWDDRDETIWDYMEGMHGNSFRNRENSIPDENGSENNTNKSYDTETDSWNNWHNRMWGFSDENLDSSEENRSENPESFFGDMRNYMRGFSDFSFNGMFDWMEEMHNSFNFNRGIMDWDERELNNNEDREFMKRFNFLNSN